MLGWHENATLLYGYFGFWNKQGSVHKLWHGGQKFANYGHEVRCVRIGVTKDCRSRNFHLEFNVAKFANDPDKWKLIHSENFKMV